MWKNRALLGRNGLLPAAPYMDKLRAHFGPDALQGCWQAPTLFWFTDLTDQSLDNVALLGLGLSAFVFFAGMSNVFIQAALWMLYFSIDTVGQRWYGFGWESQLLETGFLSIFMVSLASFSRFPKQSPTPLAAVWCYRWLIFRIMLGAGLIKIRGDSCWRDLTCMDYHYETQPVPNPLSWYLHHNYPLFHKAETLCNHFVELVAPILLLLPWRRGLMIGGAIQILFQCILIVSGNLSFLNWLTILPSLCCFDDSTLAWLFSPTTRKRVAALQHPPSPASCAFSFRRAVRGVKSVGLLVLVGWLSVPVVRNLLALDGAQAMNASFNALKLVNTYGAFGSITRTRMEVVFEGTSGPPEHPGTQWLEYEFMCKPGNISRAPCVITPYHYRLDWLMWFAAFGSYSQHPWLVHLAVKLLQGDAPVLALLAHNPFPNSPPLFIRARHYHYQFAPPASDLWWVRTLRGEYLPVLSLREPALKRFVVDNGWAWKD